MKMASQFCFTTDPLREFAKADPALLMCRSSSVMERLPEMTLARRHASQMFCSATDESAKGPVKTHPSSRDPYAEIISPLPFEKEEQPQPWVDGPLMISGNCILQTKQSGTSASASELLIGSFSMLSMLVL